MFISTLKRTAIAAGVAAVAGFAGVAAADPITFIPNVDIRIKFTNYEQVITGFGQELFGLVNITSITNAAGTVTYWNGNGSTDGTQLVGYFEGLTSIPDQLASGGLSFTGGHLVLYNVANGLFSPSTTPNTKNYANQLCGGACPTPWLTADFVAGINDPINGNATLQSAFASIAVQAGNGYLSVAGSGTNNAAFDSDQFIFTNFAAADLSLRSNFSLNTPGNQNCDNTTAQGWAVCSDDPVDARRTAPEPASLALFGLAALAAGAIRRKKVA